MRLTQVGNYAETRRNFFFVYHEDENAAVRYAMSQNKLTGQLEGTTSMKSLNEYRPDGTLNPMYEGRGRTRGTDNQRKRVKREKLFIYVFVVILTFPLTPQIPYSIRNTLLNLKLKPEI